MTTSAPSRDAAAHGESRTPGPVTGLPLSRTVTGDRLPTAPQRATSLVAGLDVASGWVVSIGLFLVAFALRLWHLGTPHDFEFDETYYAKDAWSLLHHGYVLSYVDGADKKILAGRTMGLWKDDPSMIVHPEVGKWLIAVGEWGFGMNPVGWRFSSAVVGALMVLVMVRLVRRLTGSTLLGGVAGVLLCFDGMQFVLSRLALLDVFLAFFLLCAVTCLVIDRDWGRRRLAARTAGSDPPGADDWGPVRGLLLRPWLVAAGVCFGLALGTKWTALYPMAGFGLLVWAWGAGARRSFGVRRAWLRSAVADALPAFVQVVLVALVVYLLTWTGWLLHAHDYERTLSDTQYGPYWGDYTKHDASGLGELWQSLRSLWHYHHDVYVFHTKFLDDATHAYQSKPLGWPLLNRPVGVDVQLDIKPGDEGCLAPAGSTCLRQVLLLGTPVLWWGGCLALVAAVGAWLGRRDWRAGVVVVGATTTWLPWLGNDDRPIFSYYAIAMLPFVVLALVLSLGRMLGDEHASQRRRRVGAAIGGLFVFAVVANFAWFWPIYTDQLLTTADWLRRVWFRVWI